MNKRALESLVSAGAFDSLRPETRSLNEWRGQLHGAIDVALARAHSARKARLQGQNGLFGPDDSGASDLEQLPADAPVWTRAQLLAAEKNALGFYITGHPLENYLDLLQQVNAVRSSELPSLASGNRVTIGGIISDLQSRTTKRGDRFSLFRVEDESGGTKCVAWPEAYRRHSALLQAELPALITGRLELSDDSPTTVIVDKVERLDDIVGNQINVVVIRVPAATENTELLDGILDVLNRHPGANEVLLEITVEPDLLVAMRVNAAVRVEHSKALVSDLRPLGCVVRLGSRSSVAR
jgi:DNA polymerase-3 subunit alpha